MLTENDTQQILSIVQNLEEQNKYVPYVHTVLAHPIRGSFFLDINDADKHHIEEIINEYILTKIQGFKTKGGELFRRLYENHTDEFRQFRKLNEDEANSYTPMFQELGKQLENKVFFYEGILTEGMLRNDKGLEKTVSAYHTIVYSFFPLFGHIK